MSDTLSCAQSGPADASTRDRILALLREAASGTGEGWRSGEEISALLGLSRAAVSKHVRTLRGRGFLIDAVPRRGYRLLAESGDFSAEAVMSGLRSRLLGQGDWIWLEETDTTNNVAARAAMDGAEEGSVVVAGRQSSGKGRKGRSWFSAPRSLAFTIVLRPSRAGAAEVTHRALRAVCDAVCEITGLEPELKEPNDVLLDGRKICGVLAESGHRADELEWMVIGIGVNVNARAEDFAPEIRDRAGSLLISSGRAVDRARLLRRILERLDDCYLAAEGRLVPTLE